MACEVPGHSAGCVYLTDLVSSADEVTPPVKREGVEASRALTRRRRRTRIFPLSLCCYTRCSSNLQLLSQTQSIPHPLPFTLNANAAAATAEATATRPLLLLLLLKGGIGCGSGEAVIGFGRDNRGGLVFASVAGWLGLGGRQTGCVLEATGAVGREASFCL